jgi:hypothetical protein
MAILHKVKAWLYKNLLTPDPDDYVIRVVSERTLGVHEICVSAVPLLAPIFRRQQWNMR